MRKHQTCIINVSLARGKGQRTRGGQRGTGTVQGCESCEQEGHKTRQSGCVEGGRRGDTSRGLPQLCSLPCTAELGGLRGSSVSTGVRQAWGSGPDAPTLCLERVTTPSEPQFLSHSRTYLVGLSRKLDLSGTTDPSRALSMYRVRGKQELVIASLADFQLSLRGQSNPIHSSGHSPNDSLCLLYCRPHDAGACVCVGGARGGGGRRKPSSLVPGPTSHSDCRRDHSALSRD